MAHDTLFFKQKVLHQLWMPSRVNSMEWPAEASIMWKESTSSIIHNVLWRKSKKVLCQCLTVRVVIWIGFITIGPRMLSWICVVRLLVWVMVNISDAGVRLSTMIWQYWLYFIKTTSVNLEYYNINNKNTQKKRSYSFTDYSCSSNQRWILMKSLSVPLTQCFASCRVLNSRLIRCAADGSYEGWEAIQSEDFSPTALGPGFSKVICLDFADQIGLNVWK